MGKFISKLLAATAILAVSSVGLYAQGLDTGSLNSNTENCNITIPDSQAECLSSNLSSPTSAGLSAWTITNNCTDRGDVVAKVAFQQGWSTNTTADQIVRLTSSRSTVKEKSVGAFDGVYCCLDSSDLCSHVGLCESDFSQSRAGQTCSYSSVEASGDNCEIVANCVTLAGGTYTNDVSILWSNIKNLNNCDGKLSLTSC